MPIKPRVKLSSNINKDNIKRKRNVRKSGKPTKKKGEKMYIRDNTSICIQSRRIYLKDCTFRARHHVTLKASSKYNRDDWIFNFFQLKWINKNGEEMNEIFCQKKDPMFERSKQIRVYHTDLERGFHNAFQLASYIFSQYITGVIPPQVYNGHYVKIDHEFKTDSVLTVNNFVKPGDKDISGFDFKFYALLVSIFQYSNCFKNLETKNYFFKYIHPIFMELFIRTEITLINIFKLANVPIGELYCKGVKGAPKALIRRCEPNDYYPFDSKYTHCIDVMTDYPKFNTFKPIYKNIEILDERNQTLDDYASTPLAECCSVPHLKHFEEGNPDNVWINFLKNQVIQVNEFVNNIVLKKQSNINMLPSPKEVICNEYIDQSNSPVRNFDAEESLDLNPESNIVDNISDQEINTVDLNHESHIVDNISDQEIIIDLEPDQPNKILNDKDDTILNRIEKKCNKIIDDNSKTQSYLIKTIVKLQQDLAEEKKLRKSIETNIETGLKFLEMLHIDVIDIWNRGCNRYTSSYVSQLKTIIENEDTITIIYKINPKVIE